MFELRDNSGVLGSFDSAGIRRLAKAGRLNSEMEVRELPSGQWHPISKLKNLPAGASARGAAKLGASETVLDRSFDGVHQGAPASLSRVSSRLPEDRKLALAGFLGFLLGVAIGAVYAGRGYSAEAYQEQVTRAARAETELSIVQARLQSANAKRAEGHATSSNLPGAPPSKVVVGSSPNARRLATEIDRERTFTDEKGNTMTESEITAAFAALRSRIESEQDPYMKAYLEGFERVLLSEQAKHRAGGGQ